MIYLIKPKHKLMNIVKYDRAFLFTRVGVSNLGYMYLQRYICLIRRGTFKASNRRYKYICRLFIFKYLYIYHLILFSEVIICLLLNIFMNNHEKIFCHKEI